jgi:hypothetical protein
LMVPEGPIRDAVGLFHFLEALNLLRSNGNLLRSNG